MIRPFRAAQAGFTIIELTIATLAFSVILIVITTGVLSFTHSYYRGVTDSKTQDAARSAMDILSQAIEFSGDVTVPPAPANYFCAGGHIFSYQPGHEYNADQAVSATNTGLYEEPLSGDCTAPTYSGGAELLADNMRVAYINITQPADPSTDNTYTIDLRIAYADGNDLLCSEMGLSGSCSNQQVATDSELFNPDVKCRLQSGSQFCSVAALNTSVTPRLQGD